MHHSGLQFLSLFEFHEAGASVTKTSLKIPFLAISLQSAIKSLNYNKKMDAGQLGRHSIQREGKLEHCLIANHYMLLVCFMLILNVIASKITAYMSSGLRYCKQMRVAEC